ncbi:hypothetical protein [uncultured Aquimarina sp.]|uniref:hypothetical protein n=1 Tax=uncultured Aquimarina sp. TaxID=575652 RepID=UPI0026393AFF|nr:hypothetical protein [uncultured Aquimarina sp.]
MKKFNIKKNIELSFHEDDFKRIELIPNKNYFFSKKYLEETVISNDKLDNEHGFSSIKVLDDQPIALIDEKILVSEVEEVLDKITSKRTDNIKKGYSNSYTKVKKTKAWGLEYMAVLVETKEKYTESIWLLEIGGSLIIEDSRGQKLLQLLLKLGNNFNLILIDWRKEILIDISDQEQTENYLVEELGYNLDKIVIVK